MQVNTFDILRQKLIREGININDCQISHKAILSENTTGNPLKLEDIDASNEFYFLLSDLKVGTRITSGADTLIIDDSLKESLRGKSLLMFTGTIRITVPSDPEKQLIEFMRVTPLKRKQH